MNKRERRKKEKDLQQQTKEGDKKENGVLL